MSVLSLTAAKTHLNIAVATHDDELQAMIDAAEAVIAQHAGPLAPTARTDRVPGGSGLILPGTPVSTLAAVIPVGGTAIELDDLYLDGPAGIVTYESGGHFGYRLYDVTYMAGRTECPDDLLMAVKELLRHLWSTQRGGTARPGSGADVQTPAYLLPFRVTELLAPHLQYGFA